MTARDNGRIVWHELNTTDTAAAERFYRSVTGWGMMPFELDPSYRMWTSNDGPQGGLMALPETAKAMGAPPHWLTYFGVPDVDAAVQQATALGAHTYVAPQDISNGGRFAVLADPQGAVFAVHAAAQSMGGPESDPKVGEFSWHELATTDGDAAWSFYEAMFGWVKTSAMESPAGTYQMFGRDRFTYGGIYNKPADMPAPSHWLPYIMVKNVDSALAKVTAGGGSVLNGPMDVPGGDRIVVCMDPQGAAFALHSKAPAPARASAPPAKAKPAAKVTQPKAKAKPAVVAKPKAKTVAKAKPKAKAKAKPKVVAKSKPKAKAKPKPKVVAKSKPKAKAKPKAKSRPRVKARPKSKPKAVAKSKAKPKAKAKAKAKPKAKATARTKPKSRSLRRSRARSGTRAKTRPKTRARRRLRA